MLTAALLIYHAILHVLSAPVRMPSIRQSLWSYATAGAVCGLAAFILFNTWPEPERTRNFREVIGSYLQPFTPVSETAGWVVYTKRPEERYSDLHANVPLELLRDDYGLYSPQPLIADAGAAPVDLWQPEPYVRTIAKADPEPAAPQETEDPAPAPEPEPAKPLPPKLIENGIDYTIQSGDNMWTVAKRFGISHPKLVAYNPEVNPYRMQPGDKIYVPGVSEPMPKIRVDRMAFPVKEVLITSGYGMRRHPIGGNFRFHHGIDFRARHGTQIQAVLPGVVTFAGYTQLKGRWIKIRHDNGLETVYAHNSRLKVKKGQRINQGQIIALSGSTGRVTGAHLHFEVWKDGKSQDPLKYLPYQPRYVKGSNRSRNG